MQNELRTSDIDVFFYITRESISSTDGIRELKKNSNNYNKVHYRKDEDINDGYLNEIQTELKSVKFFESPILSFSSKEEETLTLKFSGLFSEYESIYDCVFNMFNGSDKDNNQISGINLLKINVSADKSDTKKLSIFLNIIIDFLYVLNKLREDGDPLDIKKSIRINSIDDCINYLIIANDFLGLEILTGSNDIMKSVKAEREGLLYKLGKKKKISKIIDDFIFNRVFFDPYNLIENVSSNRLESYLFSTDLLKHINRYERGNLGLPFYDKSSVIFSNPDFNQKLNSINNLMSQKDLHILDDKNGLVKISNPRIVLNLINPAIKNVLTVRNDIANISSSDHPVVLSDNKEISYTVDFNETVALIIGSETFQINLNDVKYLTTNNSGDYQESNSALSKKNYSARVNLIKYDGEIVEAYILSRSSVYESKVISDMVSSISKKSLLNRKKEKAEIEDKLKDVDLKIKKNQSSLNIIKNFITGG